MAIISVIVPVYKTEKFLIRCVTSILAQTFTDFDLILVDDGSPDNCGKICDDYAAKDGRIQVLHRTNGGLSVARNTGIEWVLHHSQSDYVTFIDSDDWVESSYLVTLLDLINVDPSVGISMCSFRRSPLPDGEFGQYKHGITEFSDYYSIHGLPHVNAWGKLIKKELLHHFRFPEGKLYEDLFIMHEVLAEAEQIAYTYAPLYIYELNIVGISNSSWHIKKLDEVEACEQFLKYMKQHHNPSGIKYGTMYFCTVLERQIRGMRESGQNLAQTEKTLLKKLRCALISSLPYQSINDVSWFYQLAFPRFSSIYWNIRGILEKVGD